MHIDRIDAKHFNTLYLLCALSTVFMSLVVGIQPIFISHMVHIPPESAGEINASVQIVAEIVGLFFIAFFGYLSDKTGRSAIITLGFVIAAIGAFLAPVSLALATVFGAGGLFLFYVSRSLMAVGSAAFWPQLWTLSGDFTRYETRPATIAKVAFMMVFGGSVFYAVLMQLPKYDGFILLSILPLIIAVVGVMLARGHIVDVAPKLKKDGFPWRESIELIIDKPKMHLSFAASFYARSDMIFVGLFIMLWCMYQADVSGVSRETAVSQAGMLIAYVGVLVLISIPVWSTFMRRWGRVESIGSGLLLSGVGCISLVFIGDPFSVFALIPLTLIGLGQAGCLIAPQVLMLDETPPEMRGTMMSLFHLVGGLGIIFLVQSGGFYFDALGPQAPFILIGTGNLLLVGYAYWLRRAETRGEELPSPYKTGFKPMLIVLSALPFAWLMGRLFMSGVFDDAPMPAGYQQRFLGDWALNFLILSLAITPLRDITGIKELARYSRNMGLIAFTYVVLHVINYIWIECDFVWSYIARDILFEPYLWFGLSAFLLLIPLAISSNNNHMKSLGGKQWKSMHRLVYIINPLAAIHFVLAADQDYMEPVIYLLVILYLLAYRVRKNRKINDRNDMWKAFEEWFDHMKPLLRGEKNWLNLGGDEKSAAKGKRGAR